MSDAKPPRISKTASKLDNWNAVISTDEEDGPTLVTFGRNRSDGSAEYLSKRLSEVSLVLSRHESMRDTGGHQPSVQGRKDSSVAQDVKKAMRGAKAASAGKLARIAEGAQMEESAASPELVEIVPRNRGGDRSGKRRAGFDVVNPSAFEDTPGAELYVPMYGSFRVETGDLSEKVTGKNTGTSLPNTLAVVASSDLDYETDDTNDGKNDEKMDDKIEQMLEADEREHRSSNRLTNFTDELSFASSSTITGGKETKKSSKYKSRRGFTSKRERSHSSKIRTQFVTDTPQGMLMTDLTSILKDKFLCGVQRKKNELRVAVSLADQPCAVVVSCLSSKAGTVTVNFRRSKADFSKISPNDFNTFYKNVRKAFEDCRGKETILAHGDGPSQLENG